MPRTKSERVIVGTVELSAGAFHATYQPERKRVKLESANSLAIFDIETTSNFGYIQQGGTWQEFHANAKPVRFNDGDAQVIRFAVANATATA